MDEPDFWEVERGFWLEGAPRFRAWMAKNCVMVFPPPVGIMTRDAILDAVDHMPRWDDVTLSATTLSRVAADAVVLAYHAEGTRTGQAPYRVTCTSTYHRGPDGWRLIQHQHTLA